METQKNNKGILVGIFVTIGLVIFVLGVFTLGGQQNAFVKTIEITAIFNDVDGLQQGNNIWFSGVKVGIVKHIAFYNQSQVKVTMHIQQKAQEFIRSDAKATISSDGLIGNKIIVLQGGTPSAPHIEGGEILAVKETTSSDEMLATLQQNNRNLSDITRDIKIVSQRLANGEGALGALLTDKKLYTELSSVLAGLETAAQHSKALTGNLAAYTQKLQQPGTFASDIVSDTTIVPALRNVTRQLMLASTNAAEATGNLKEATTRLNTTNGPAGVLLNDEKAAGDLRSALQYLNSSSKKLDQDLEAVQHNFLLRGFFRKKAKEEAKAMKDSLKAANQN